MSEKKSVFKTLFEINVNDHIEKKNGLSFLPWAYAWGEAKKLYPEANYKVYETENGCIYFTDGRTCWVKTSVTIEGLEHIERLPILDYRNKSIPLESVTSFDANNSIQRSLTKALARHGLGLYLYSGEDLPEIEVEKISAKDANILKNVVKNFDDPDNLYSALLERYNVKSFRELTVKQRTEILEGLNEMARNRGVKNGDKVHGSGKAEGQAKTENV